MAVTSAPDCETNASCPGRAGMCAKLAFSRARVLSSPTQLGPRMRSSAGRAASSMACFCSAVRPALTAKVQPATPLLRMLRHSVPPTENGRSDAPMTATDRGSNNESRLRMLMGLGSVRRKSRPAGERQRMRKG
jgi:hypothetical protein